MTERKASWAVRQTWKRFCGWYGADVVERKFGLQPPADWCDAIDALDDSKLERVMTGVRAKFATWPPSLPEFEQIARDLRRVAASTDEPTIQEQLKSFVLRSRALTGNQFRMPWTFLGTGNARTGEGFAVTGVVVPPDGEHRGYRVMVDDMRGFVS